MNATLTTGKHVYRLERDGSDPGRHRYACTCGFATASWATSPTGSGCTRSPKERPGGCPKDPAVRSLSTLQFAYGGLFDATPFDYLIHLVRSCNVGTPGPTLCGMDRFAEDGPGFSVGGGVSGGPIVLHPCEGCAAAAEFPGLPVSGSVGAEQMARHLGVKTSTFPW